MTAPARALELLERIQARADRAAARLDALVQVARDERAPLRRELELIASEAAEVAALLAAAPAD